MSINSDALLPSAQFLGKESGKKEASTAEMEEMAARCRRLAERHQDQVQNERQAARIAFLPPSRVL
jgi:hypothetical protein